MWIGSLRFYLAGLIVPLQSRSFLCLHPDPRMLLPADIVMDVQVMLCCVFFLSSTRCPEVWRAVKSPMLRVLVMLVCAYVCVLSAPAVQVYMQTASVCPVRDALITKQDVKHFSSDLVLVIAPQLGC